MEAKSQALEAGCAEEAGRLRAALGEGAKTQAAVAVEEAGRRQVEILLIEEHRMAGPGLPGIQWMAMGKGWHGVWDATRANGNGRSSGGTAVLVREPLRIASAEAAKEEGLAAEKAVAADAWAWALQSGVFHTNGEVVEAIRDTKRARTVSESPRPFSRS